MYFVSSSKLIFYLFFIVLHFPVQCVQKVGLCFVYGLETHHRRNSTNQESIVQMFLRSIEKKKRGGGGGNSEQFFFFFTGEFILSKAKTFGNN